MNVYDFDNTIYDGDSSIDFFLYALSRDWKIGLKIPGIFLLFIMNKMKLTSTERLKEHFFAFITHMENAEGEVQSFALKNMSKIKAWYLMGRSREDIIITASPEFLVQAFMDHLEGQRCIGTRLDIRTGRISEKNCRGDEKVIRYRELYGDKPVASFYSDSMSDMPMALLAEKAYLIKKEHIRIFTDP